MKHIILVVIFSIAFSICTFAQDTKPGGLIYVATSAVDNSEYFVILPSIHKTANLVKFVYIKAFNEDNYYQTYTIANCKAKSLAEFARDGKIGGQAFAIKNPEPKYNVILQGSVGEAILNKVCSNGLPQ